MDGTYNNPYVKAQSSLSPSTASGGAYKANVNRQKTRKWVEAKVQSYDGDDWGADEFEEDEEDDHEPAPPPVPRVTTGLRPIGQRLPSETHEPSPRLAAAVAASNARSASGPPPLQIETSSPALDKASVPQQSPASGNGKETSISDTAPTSGSASHARNDTRSLPSQIADSPAVERGTPVARAPDIFQRIEDERGTPDLTKIATTESSRSITPAEPVQLRDEPAASHTEPVGIEDTPETTRGRQSTSPKLPDVTRMSTFGSDFFSTTGDSLNAPLASQSSPVQTRTDIKVSETPPPEGVQLSGVGPVATTSDAAPKGPQPASAVCDPAVEQESETPSYISAPLLAAGSDNVSPLRTIGPRDPGTGSSGRDIALTTPLQTGHSQPPMSDFAAPNIQREQTFGTSTSSPAKESDMLSEEIMKSLTPGGAAPLSLAASTDKSTADSPAGLGKSYTLRDYDDHWADNTENRQIEGGPDTDEPKPIHQIAPGGAQDVPSVPAPDFSDTPAQAVEATSPLDPKLRQRFSWEALAAQNAALATMPPPINEPNTKLATADEQPPAPPAKDESSSIPIPEQEKEVLSAAAPPTIVVPTTVGVTREIPNASSAQSGDTQPPVLGPPSPVSVRTNESNPQVLGDRNPSLVDGRMVGQTASVSVSATPPPDDLTTTITAVSSTPLGQLPKVAGLREIMNLPTPAQRVDKFAESRQAFATAEIGLENWLLSLKSEHPEYASATAYFSGVIHQGPVRGGNGAAVPGPNSTSQQPYYQQYLNASSPTATTGPAPGRARIPSSSQAASSAFGNSSNQIGTKSKELMQSAGKMGKGLFSKGKSKLRGTGDKDEPTRFYSEHEKIRQGRRSASWALGAGSRSDATASRLDKVRKLSIDIPRHHRPAAPQQSRQARARTVDFSSENLTSRFSASYTYHGAPETEASKPTSEEVKRSSQTNKGQAGNRWSTIATPISHSKNPWDPSDRPPVSKEDLLDRDGPPVPPKDYPPPISQATPREHHQEGLSKDFVVGTHLVQSPMQMVTTEPSSLLRGPALGQNTGDEASSSLPQDYTPRRNSSFIGLPPIRRGSTFALHSKAARPVAERFSLDEDEGTLVNPGTAPTTTAPTESKLVTSPMDVSPQSSEASLNYTTGQDEQLKSPLQGDFDPLDAPNVSVSPAPMITPAMTGNPVQRLPPSGPWKLEESKLSAPLQTSRHRAGSANSQNQPDLGFDKETGAMSPSRPQTKQPPPRQKGSDVPPSSTTRYPELFSLPSQASQQRAGSSSWSSTTTDLQVRGRFSYDESGTRSEEAAEEEQDAVEERGRSKRSSRLFKGIGQRFNRSSSRGRGTSIERERPSREWRLEAGDEASESSITTEELQERRKGRGSFLYNLRNRPSEGRNSMNAERLAQPEQDKPDSLFSESRLSGLFRGKARDTGTVGSDPSVSSPLSPMDRRNSAFTGKKGVSALFQRRSSTDQLRMSPMTHSQTPDPSMTMTPPPKPYQEFMRSNTATPYSISSTKSSTAATTEPEPSARHSRRGSAAGLITGLLGHVTRGKQRDEEALAETDRPPSRPQMLRRMTGSSSLLEDSAQTPTASSYIPPADGVLNHAAATSTLPSRQNEHPDTEQAHPLLRKPSVGAWDIESPILPKNDASVVVVPFPPSQLSLSPESGPRNTPPISSTTQPVLQSAPNPHYHASQSSLDMVMRSTAPRYGPREGKRPSVGSSSIFWKGEPGPVRETTMDFPRTDPPQTSPSFASRTEPASIMSSNFSHDPPALSASTTSLSGHGSTQTGSLDLSQASSNTTPTQRFGFDPRPTMQHTDSPPVSQDPKPLPRTLTWNSDLGSYVSGSRKPSVPQPFQQLPQSQSPPLQQQHSVQSSHHMPQKVQPGLSQAPLKDNSQLLQPPQQDQQASASSSRWKGIRNRLSGQAPTKPSEGTTKLEVREKSSTSKFLNALKRGPKQPPTQQGQTQEAQGPRSSQNSLAPQGRVPPQAGTKPNPGLARQQPMYEPLQWDSQPRYMNMSTNPPFGQRPGQMGPQPGYDPQMIEQPGHAPRQMSPQIGYGPQAPPQPGYLPRQMSPQFENDALQMQPQSQMMMQQQQQQQRQHQGLTPMQGYLPNSVSGRSMTSAPQATLNTQGIEYNRQYRQSDPSQPYMPQYGGMQSPPLSNPASGQRGFLPPAPHHTATAGAVPPSQVSPPLSAPSPEQVLHPTYAQKDPPHGIQEQHPMRVPYGQLPLAQWDSSGLSTPQPMSQPVPQATGSPGMPRMDTTPPMMTQDGQPRPRGIVGEINPQTTYIPTGAATPAPAPAPAPAPTLAHGLGLVARETNKGVDQPNPDLDAQETLENVDVRSDSLAPKAPKHRKSGSNLLDKARGLVSKSKPHEKSLLQGDINSSQTKISDPAVRADGRPNTATLRQDAREEPAAGVRLTTPPPKSETEGDDSAVETARAVRVVAKMESPNFKHQSKEWQAAPRNPKPESKSPSDVSFFARETRKQASTKQPATTMTAELENTQDAHARTARLQSQEEKIHYDPQADSDGERAPEMAATSYPGQEWNPYGEPEFGDWND